MTTSNITQLGTQRRIDLKKKRLELLYKQLEAAYAQLDQELNRINVPSINAIIAQLEVEIEALEADIEQLQQSKLLENRELEPEKLYRNYHKNWEANLHKIDFSQTNDILNRIVEKLDSQEGATLFLIHNSHSMGGKWCIENIQVRLKSISNYWASPIELGFLPYEQTKPLVFLNKLAKKLRIEPIPDNLQTYTNVLIDKICASLYSGHIFWLQVEIECLAPDDELLDWFVNQFWSLLVQRLPLLSQDCPLVRLVGVVTVLENIPEDRFPKSLCCQQQHFNNEKMLELPLQHWQEDEVRNWLFVFSGLMHPSSGHTRTQVEQMARSIFTLSQGRPIDVYHRLMAVMTERVS